MSRTAPAKAEKANVALTCCRKDEEDLARLSRDIRYTLPQWMARLCMLVAFNVLAKTEKSRSGCMRGEGATSI